MEDEREGIVQWQNYDKRIGNTIDKCFQNTQFSYKHCFAVVL